jgi:hypothetical protein
MRYCDSHNYSPLSARVIYRFIVALGSIIVGISVCVYDVDVMQTCMHMRFYKCIALTISYIHTYIHIYMHIYAYICMCICIYIYIYMYVYMHYFLYQCICNLHSWRLSTSNTQYIRMCAYTYIHIRMYIFMLSTCNVSRMCVYTYIHIRMYIFTLFTP